jgi:hypothetical protein
MRRVSLSAWLASLVCVVCAAGSEIPVVVAPQSPAVVRIAAEDLGAYLAKIYPRDQFPLAEHLPTVGRAILLGSVDVDPRLQDYTGKLAPAAAESYLVAAAAEGRCQLGVIAGADARGAAHGCYALLARLGFDFGLSGDTEPTPRREPFSFVDWHLSDRPLIGTRLVFNWHNFLSGCSAWNLAEWQAWIRQSQRMGYNGVMVHAYGNNPMVSFTFNGRTKPVGYLSTTVRGRDWSTQHVADVRHLWGGQVFRSAVFGADAALGPAAVRTAAAQRLMREVFAHACRRAMDVYFATDVDTFSANPQELIETLPPQARFLTGSRQPLWLANPDTPEGYRYYKTQVESLLAAYPQITDLVVWFRPRGTPWLEMKRSDMPSAWQAEYQAEVGRTPGAERLWKSHHIFALGKIVRAFDRALGELGSRRVRLAAGTWGFEFLAPCDRFFPAHVALIGLDYNVLHDRPQLGDAESRRVIAAVGARRAVIPVIWAHHDDGNYLGRPYTPFDSFHAKLVDARATGFGIIHWTTRPLDLFFASHIRQVWQQSKDQPLTETCKELAAKWFGAAAVGPMAGYLQQWITEAPQFARETSDFFIDRPLTNAAEVVAGCQERLRRIESASCVTRAPAQRERLDYFRGLERFIAAFYPTHAAFQNAQALARKGDLAAARQLMAECHPEPIIEQFAQFSSRGGITRGEQGLVVSLNLRWLPHYIQLRQRLGLEPVRYRFGPTSHDRLAQAAGTYTYAFDAQHRLWQTLGAQETGAAVRALADVADENCRTAIESDRPLTLAVRPMLRGASLSPGRYRLRLWMADPLSTACGQRVFTVSIADSTVRDRIDIFQSAGRPKQAIERTYPVTVGRNGVVQFTLTPEHGKTLLCACRLEPAGE